MTTTRTWLGIILLISVVTTVSCEPTPGPAGGTPTPVTYRSLILETVMTNRTVRPQNPDGTYPALSDLPIPTPYAEVRFQADQFLVYTVTANGRDIPLFQNPTQQHNWFTLRDDPLASGMRKRFQVIHVDFPVDMEFAKKITLSIKAVVFSGSAPPPLDVVLVSTHPLRPTDVFVQGSNNTKPAMTDSIVTSDVVVGGWLVEGQTRSRGTAGAGPNESEDVHYPIWIDNDFLVRNYVVGNIVLEPLASAIMKRNQSYYHGPFAQAVRIPLIQNGVVNAGALTIPGDQILNVELNAWHIAARGSPPAGWQPDPSPASKDAYPWNADAPWGGHVLNAGDYIIVSGNLWQDTGKIKNCTETATICALRRCWEDGGRGNFLGYAGWLEIHPPNSIRFVDPPGPRQPGDPPTRKDTSQLQLCEPVVTAYDRFLSPTTPDPDPNLTSVLHFETQVDGRFASGTAAVHSEVIEPTCQGQLHVSASVPVGSSATFKVVYLMWWEPGTIPRKDHCPLAPQARPPSMPQDADE